MISRRSSSKKKNSNTTISLPSSTATVSNPPAAFPWKARPPRHHDKTTRHPRDISPRGRFPCLLLQSYASENQAVDRGAPEIREDLQRRIQARRRGRSARAYRLDLRAVAGRIASGGRHTRWCAQIRNLRRAPRGKTPGGFL